MPNANLTNATVPGSVADALATIGRNIVVARTRRRLRQRDLAEKAGISIETLGRIERGTTTTAIAAYFTVLWVLGLEREFANLASPDRDEEGKTLERARLPRRVRPAVELSNDF